MANKKTAVIIGVSSQDGSYLADSLLEKGYNVVGTIRRTTNPDKENIGHLLGKIKLDIADLLDYETLIRVFEKNKPDEIYNFAAQSIPADSWSHPFYTGEVTALGVVRVLEAAKHYAKNARVYQATTREIYGNIDAEYANEKTPIDANNPYGIAKAYAHMMVRCYRESYDMYVTGGILFNHESPRRSLHFVTRKVTAAVACIKNKVKSPPLDELGEPLVDKNGKLQLGFLGAKRDWGYAKEYVEAAWLMLQQDKPEDYVIGTGETHSVEDLCRVAFGHAGLDWEKYVISNKKLLRPTEIKELKADSSLAKKELGWEPRMSFEDLVKLMVDSDLKRFK
ncbi:MAG: GDP-mannose 4,6-dehydratase [Candidatus Woesebacteria bacterium GW2011_GWB1_45_5]|uniref:GDP-mannose 4,6-dehydratase n=1 Tax=Candidatus Woesebacteria bacterium GW2011_GWB1_45_5 TaxID=1618581 RepID=A0A0G1QPT3_9BACT|nr:MAG: GDP-mannose 4,6-dehydratase [Candidatus Woesebacteria bacterium GW2011_GWB1_45_5]